MTARNLAFSGDLFEELFLPKDNTTSNNRPYWIDREEVSNAVQPAGESITSTLEDQSETKNDFSEIEGSPIIFFRPERVRDKPFLSLQKWQGVVVEISNEYFKAKLFDLYNDSFEEIAEIPIEEVLPEDLELLKIGGIFYWNIGYEDPFGTRRRTSLILFRRLPELTKASIKRAELEAIKKFESLDWGK